MNKTRGRDRKGPKSRSLSTHPGFVLTSREIEIVKLVAGGHSNKKIAQLLGIRHKTVQNHRNNINRKMNLQPVQDAIGLINKCLIWGIIDTGDLMEQ